MNNVIERVWPQSGLTHIEDLKGSVFTAESGGHTFRITGVDSQGNAVPLTGTVTGVFLRPDNTDVTISGETSNGAASVTLSDECYDVPGRFGITIYLTADSQKTAIYAAVGSVTRASSGNVSPQGSASVVDLINQINAAVESIPASYTGLLADIAPTYSDNAVYPVGAYVYYGGDLYRCISAITTAESWNASHWEAAVIGDDLDALRVDVQELDQTKADAADIAPTYSDNAVYQKGSHVFRDGVLYVSKGYIWNPEPWNADHWDQVALSEAVIPMMDSDVATMVEADRLSRRIESAMVATGKVSAAKCRVSVELAANRCMPAFRDVNISADDRKKIAAAVRDSVPPGMGTEGNASATLPDGTVVRYVQAALLSPFVTVILTPGTGYSSSTADVIKAAVVDYINSRRPGTTIYTYDLRNAIEETVPGNAYTITAIGIGTISSNQDPVLVEPTNWFYVYETTVGRVTVQEVNA